MTQFEYSSAFKHFFILTLLSGCQVPELTQVTERPSAFLAKMTQSIEASGASAELKVQDEAVSLGGVLDGSIADKNSGSDFVSVIRYALENDPRIISKRRDLDSKIASIDYAEAQKDFQVSSTIYGGIEDITDSTSGIAVSLNASRLVYDGGLVDAQVDVARFTAEAARLKLKASLNERALRLGTLWIELEKYQTLQDQIKGRLRVLDPLIEQLEQVAKAGIGDVSKVTAAQRTVSTIRVAETNVSEGLAQAKIDFLNAFGELQVDINYDPDFVADLLPAKITNELAENSPLLLSLYSEYKASLASVSSIKAKDGFNVGFEARAMMPYAGSSEESDESIGLVARKTLFNDKTVESEIEQAVSTAAAIAQEIRATYREGMRAIGTARQNIDSMDKAINLAGKNAQITADEIIYLKQQLVIGGSTLDSVLSAEARLYDAESKEINFLAEKLKSQLRIASGLGLLSEALGL